MKSGVAARRREIVRRVDQFRDDDDVLVVVAKEVGGGLEPHVRLSVINPEMLPRVCSSS